MNVALDKSIESTRELVQLESSRPGKLEAAILDKTAKKDQVDNRRRKWDCFHIATAMALGCRTLYTIDEGMKNRQSFLSIKGIQFLEPLPRALELGLSASSSSLIV